MTSELQTSFSGGMADTAFDGALPENSYLFASNFDLRGGRLVGRPRVETVRARSLGMATIRNIGLFRFSDTAFGDCLFYVEHDYMADEFAFVGYLLNASGVYLGSIQLAFPDLFGATDGRFHGSATEVLAPHYVGLQVGGVAFAWFTRGGVGYAFRWDGTTTGTPPALSGAFTQLSTVYGVGDYVPPCRSALHAYGRVFLAVETGATGVFSSVSVSAPVDNAGVSKLVFGADKTDCGLGGTDDILGMSALGNGRIVAFKRNSVWLLSGCDRDPANIVVECIDADHGCVGHSAFVTFDKGCWFISDDGIRVVDLSGRALRVPKSQPISEFWARVMFPAAPSPLLSAVVFGDRLLFSVFVDSSVNAAILVYSLTGDCWVGIWQQAGMNCMGLAVGDLSTGRQLKMLGLECDLQALSLTLPMLFSATAAGRFTSRPFVCGKPSAEKMFTNGSVLLQSCGMYGSTAVDLVAAFATLDPILKTSVTHVSAATVTGLVSAGTFIGRVLRSCALDLTFTAGSAQVWSAGARSSAK